MILTGTDPCSSQPCQNGGTCQALNSNNFQCICPPGYSGFDCSIRKFNIDKKRLEYKTIDLGDPCAQNPCLNGGQCFPTNIGGFTCQCPNPYTGQRCEDRKIDSFLRIVSQLFLN